MCLTFFKMPFYFYFKVCLLKNQIHSCWWIFLCSQGIFPAAGLVHIYQIVDLQILIKRKEYGKTDFSLHIVCSLNLLYMWGAIIAWIIKNNKCFLINVNKMQLNYFIYFFGILTSIFMREKIFFIGGPIKPLWNSELVKKTFLT